MNIPEALAGKVIDLFNEWRMGKRRPVAEVRQSILSLHEYYMETCKKIYSVISNGDTKKISNKEIAGLREMVIAFGTKHSTEKTKILSAIDRHRQEMALGDYFFRNDVEHKWDRLYGSFSRYCNYDMVNGSHILNHENAVGIAMSSPITGLRQMLMHGSERSDIRERLLQITDDHVTFEVKITDRHSIERMCEVVMRRQDRLLADVLDDLGQIT